MVMASMKAVLERPMLINSHKYWRDSLVFMPPGKSSGKQHLGDVLSFLYHMDTPLPIVHILYPVLFVLHWVPHSTRHTLRTPLCLSSHCGHHSACGHHTVIQLCAILTYLVKLYSVVTSSRKSGKRKQEWVLAHLFILFPQYIQRGSMVDRWPPLQGILSGSKLVSGITMPSKE